MSKCMYLVTLKLDEADIRDCHPLRNSFDSDEYITHSAYGWYNVRVMADDEESAVARAKKNLAKYKNVRVEDFFENTSRPTAWSIDLFLVCPECQRQYKGWQMKSLEYYVCPHCRRRCVFEEDKEETASSELRQRLDDAFNKIKNSI